MLGNDRIVSRLLLPNISIVKRLDQEPIMKLYQEIKLAYLNVNLLHKILRAHQRIQKPLYLPNLKNVRGNYESNSLCLPSSPSVSLRSKRQTQYQQLQEPTWLLSLNAARATPAITSIDTLAWQNPDTPLPAVVAPP